MKNTSAAKRFLLCNSRLCVTPACWTRNYSSPSPHFHHVVQQANMASGGSVIKSGFLKVEIEGKYITQWIELTEKSLNYFDKKEKSTFFFIGSGRAQTGSVDLDYHSQVTSIASSGDCEFSIIRDGKAMKFVAETRAEKKDWVRNIEDVINEEEMDARLSGGAGALLFDLPAGMSSPPAGSLSSVGPLTPVATPSTRKTYKSYLKEALDMSASRNGPWTQAWFILSMEALTYYSSSSSTSLTTDRLGSLIISESSEVHNDEDDDLSGGSPFIFRVTSNEHTLYLAATSEESRLRWMNTIHSVKKMNLCRAEGDLATMWQWEAHLKDTMSVENMPTDPKLKLRSASLFGFRPGSFDTKAAAEEEDQKEEGFFSGKIVPRGLNSVFGAIESGAQSTVSGIASGARSTVSVIESGAQSTAAGISSGAKSTVSGLSQGIDTLDNGRKLVQGGLVDGTGALINTLDSGVSMFIPTFGEDGMEDFEARSDSFCEYEDDEESEESEEEGSADINNTWKTSQARNLTVELTTKLIALATVVGGLALLLLLFISHSVIFDLGYLIMAMECFTVGLIVFLAYQQVLGYLLGMAVRYALTKSIHGDGTKFDLHFEAIKLNVGMDILEVEIREIVWMNPDKFKGSYGQTFLKVKAVRVMIPILSLYCLLINKKKVLKIDQILVDSPLVTLAEAGSDDEREMNVLCAVGKSEANKKTDTESESETVTDSANKPTSSNTAPSGEKGRNKDKDKDKSDPFCIDLNSFILLNLKIRLRNIFKVKSNNLQVPHVVMTRPNLTGAPKKKAIHRVPLPVPQLAVLLAKEVGGELVAGNKVAMLGILSSSGARHLLALFDPRNLAKALS